MTQSAFVNDTCPKCKIPVSAYSGYCPNCGWKSPKA